MDPAWSAADLFRLLYPSVCHPGFPPVYQPSSHQPWQPPAIPAAVAWSEEKDPLLQGIREALRALVHNTYPEGSTSQDKFVIKRRANTFKIRSTGPKKIASNLQMDMCHNPKQQDGTLCGVFVCKMTHLEVCRACGEVSSGAEVDEWTADTSRRAAPWAGITGRRAGWKLAVSGLEANG
ncbi:hypothetical protein EYF80_041322 [Liparis tanakae]|uniref:Uncharacterized protein n=1 Tax=Liparis tanakae TaxID=230148 RepID=A0A4Z2G5H5_9TELE|nr:hypothetical protein EYF80_041322 [Liparis tanakae]